jgi:hypothetical protein
MAITMYINHNPMYIKPAGLTILAHMAKLGRPVTKVEALECLIPENPYNGFGNCYFVRAGHGYQYSLWLQGLVEQVGKAGRTVLWGLTPLGKSFAGKSEDQVAGNQVVCGIEVWYRTHRGTNRPQGDTCSPESLCRACHPKVSVLLTTTAGGLLRPLPE